MKKLGGGLALLALAAVVYSFGDNQLSWILTLGLSVVGTLLVLLYFLGKGVKEGVPGNETINRMLSQAEKEIVIMTARMTTLMEPAIYDALVEKLSAGVQVCILVENASEREWGVFSDLIMEFRSRLDVAIATGALDPHFWLVDRKYLFVEGHGKVPNRYMENRGVQAAFRSFSDNRIRAKPVTMFKS